MIGLKKKAKAKAAQAAAETMETETEELAAAAAAGPAAASASAAGRGRGRGRGVSIIGVKRTKGKSKAKRKMKPGEIRVQRDVAELDGGDCAVPMFPNPNDLMNFEVRVTPDDGYWKGFEYNFKFEVPDMYPHEPPKVKCLNKIYHPNIDLEGNVCLNILRADWKPVLDINAVIYGLIVLFVQPNPDDPLNKEAAQILRTNARQFEQNVERSLKGLSVAGETFPPAIRARA